MRGRMLLGLGLLCSVLLFAVQPVHADVNDFTVTSFSSEQWLDNGDKQGTLRIVEKIDVTFTDNNHGILRAIPARYNGQSLQLKVNAVSSTSGAPSSYTTSDSNGNTVLKIGSPSQTVTGPQQYTIDYTVKNVIGFYDDHDELYWDINGDQWSQPFERVAAVLHLPNGLTLEKNVCYTGAFGGKEQACRVTQQDGLVQARAMRALGSNETLTVAYAFPKGYFAPMTLQERLAQYIVPVLSVSLPVVLIGGWGLRYWWRNGKDLRGRGVIVPEYDAPKGLSVAEAATVYSYQLPAKAVSATIIDLAIRKYIRIHETVKKKLLKDQTEYTFELTNSEPNALKPHEQQILDGIFGSSAAVGTQVALSSLKNKFYTVSQKMSREMPKALADKQAGYFAANPLTSGARLFIVGAICIVAGFVFRGWAIAGFIIAAVICFTLGFLMPRRTALGVAVNEHLKGLKLYLETAEKDRIAMLQSPNAPYAQHAGEPKKTVELFEKLLPYAIVFGVEKQWAEQFKDLYTTPPDWYTGNWTAFNAAYLATSLNSSMNAMNTTFSPPSSSGGSGFSGGGSSGGGGGGGGGGGW